MRNPKDKAAEEADDKTAERLKDFLKRRLPPGVSHEEVNPALPEHETNTDRDEEHPAANDDRNPSAGKSDGS